MTDRTRGFVLRSPEGARYRFDPGALSLEFLLTGGPGPQAARHESLHEPGDLGAWAARSRLALRPGTVRVAPDDVPAARRLRDALWRLVGAVIAERERPAADIAELNAAAREALVPRMTEDGRHGWAAPPTGRQVIGTVARDAIGLLTGPHAARVRQCATDTCSLVFVDTSRPGRRRWCSMERCGNLQKARALRERRRTAAG
ncbi:ABATE domain-containing protein [Streptomyces sp. RFCAC02]|uniref:CGNR zinc finger domain-containing protein n=1 Tax=Streptomyces sp. RFCAC02 TaxID=2499143 RepID=UPI00101F621C|nr:ABATE domain-containing protein [Streptomyces sp. RFCAC02]